MDIDKTLRGLYEEKKRLDASIAILEKRLKAVSGHSTPKRRGRKSMSAEERRQVSERMAKYWKARRAEARALEAAADSATAPAAS